MYFDSCCPFCKKEITLDIDAKGQTTVEGLRSIPDDVIKALGVTGQEDETLTCFFCPFTTTGDRIGMVLHVQSCNQRTFPCVNKDCDAKIKLETGFDSHLKTECKKVRCPDCPFQGSFEQAEKHKEVHMLLSQLQQRCDDFSRFLRGYSLFDEKLVDQFGIDSFVMHIEDFSRHYNSGDIIYGLFQHYRPCRPPQPPSSMMIPGGPQPLQVQPPSLWGPRASIALLRSLTIPPPPPGWEDDIDRMME